MALATHIAVVDAGRIIQYGPPDEIYGSPVTLDVARFIGTANEMHVHIEEAGTLRTPAGSVQVSPQTSAGLAGRAILLTRPEHWRISKQETGGSLTGHVISSAFLGPVREHVVSLQANSENDLTIMIRGTPTERFEVGAQVACWLLPEGPLLFPDAEQ